MKDSITKSIEKAYHGTFFKEAPQNIEDIEDEIASREADSQLPRDESVTNREDSNKDKVEYYWTDLSRFKYWKATEEWIKTLKKDENPLVFIKLKSLDIPIPAIYEGENKFKTIYGNVYSLDEILKIVDLQIPK